MVGGAADGGGAVMAAEYGPWFAMGEVDDSEAGFCFASAALRNSSYLECMLFNRPEMSANGSFLNSDSNVEKICVLSDSLIPRNVRKWSSSAEEDDDAEEEGCEDVVADGLPFVVEGVEKLNGLAAVLSVLPLAAVDEVAPLAGAPNENSGFGALPAELLPVKGEDPLFVPKGEKPEKGAGEGAAEAPASFFLGKPRMGLAAMEVLLDGCRTRSTSVYPS